MPDPIDVVRRCFKAYTDNDRTAIESLIADDFVFTSPLDNRIDRTTYFARCWPNHRRITACSYPRLIGHGDTVIATYEMQTEGGGGFRNTEVLTLRDGKLAKVEVYFGWSLPHRAAPGRFVDA